MISRADNRRFQLRGIPILVAGALALATPTRGDQPDAANIAHFESKIRPVLVNHCYECHSAGSDEIKGGLTLDTRDGIRGGSETGPAVVPGDVDESLILEALRHDGLEMPPDMRLPDRMIADFETWIARGAPDPRDGTTPAVASTVGTDVDLDTGRRHWAFQPPRRPDVPAPPDYLANRVRTPIDAYVALRLAEQGLNFAADADRRTLIRRLYFDLIGLPPTPAEVDTFLADESPEAYERLVDYLLASLRSLPTVMVIGSPEERIPVLSFAISDVPAERVVQRLADNGILAIPNMSSRVLDLIGVNDIGGAVTVGLAHYSTTAEVDQLVRALASLG